MNAEQPYKQAVINAWRTLAPDVAFQTYLSEVVAHQEAHLGQIPDVIIEKTDDADQHREAIDLARHRLARARYYYAGLDTVQSAAKAGQPLLMLAWHQGAREYLAHGLSRVIPELAVFSYRERRIGDLRTESLRDLGFRSLARIKQHLSEGGAVLHYLDGLPLGRTTPANVLGTATSCPVGPLLLLQHLTGLRPFVVSSRYQSAQTIYIAFHDFQARLPAAQWSDVTAALETGITVLQENLRQVAPTQVHPQFMVLRELVAAKVLTGTTQDETADKA